MCSADSFLGHAALRDAGLSGADFDMVCKWSRMAPRRERPADSRPRVVETASQLGISPDEATDLGMKCRQLMDSGRARYLESQGFSVALVHHVGREFTADNVMLLCTRQPSRPLENGEDAERWAPTL